MNDFVARTIPAFTGPNCGVRLVDVTTGKEIKPGQTIPEPYGHGRITYLGPTRSHPGGRPDAPAGPRRRRPLHRPETDWVFLPAELYARYEATHATARTTR